jgi:hypothetical protein
MSTYREVIREILRSTNLADPGEVGALALERMDDEQKAEALLPLLRDAARLAMGAERYEGGHAAQEPSTVKSRKLASARQYVAEFLRTRVYTGENGWKMLADATFADLTYVAEERRAMALANVRAAERYEYMAKLLERHQVTTMVDLPEAVLRDLDEGN